MPDTKKLASIALLGWNFWAHMIRKYVLRKKSPGYDQFMENYRHDRIVPLSEKERERMPEYSKCISCGLCDPVCPSLRAAGRAHFAGPMDLAMCVSRDPSEFGVSPDPFRSLLCEACDRACPEGVPVAEIVTYMRRKARETRPDLLPPFYSAAMSNLDKTGNVYGAPKPPVIPSDARILYWRGCREAQALAKGGVDHCQSLLEQFGIKFQAVAEDCCGGMPAQMGLDYQPSKALQAISNARVDIVITGCPLCLRTIQKALPDVRVRHMLSVLAEKMGDDLKPLKGRQVAYHDSCLLGGAMGIYEMPREIIRKLGGELVRLPRERDEAPCCGAGGVVPEVDLELSLRIARDRIEEVIAAGAPLLLTSCGECAEHFRKSLRNGESLEVRTIAEVILGKGGNGNSY